MSETTTAVVIAAAAVGLFLLYQSSQQQAAVQNAILLKLAQPTPAPAAASNPLGALAPLIGPILSLL